MDEELQRSMKDLVTEQTGMLENPRQGPIRNIATEDRNGWVVEETRKMAEEVRDMQDRDRDTQLQAQQNRIRTSRL